MVDLPENLFSKPIWHALGTRHRHFAVRSGEACRYPADVAPFAAVAQPNEQALRDLSSLIAERESLWIIGDDFPRVPELTLQTRLPCLQMVLDDDRLLPAVESDIGRLRDEDAGDMVALTDLAFPGFFRPGTCRMGAYYGVRREGKLIAMGGERMLLDGYSEISGLCTHPSHRGEGLAAGLLARLAQAHRDEGVISWLHVVSDNRHAIELYERVGFKRIREVSLWKISRNVNDF